MELIKERAEEVRKYYEGLVDDEIIVKIADENERMETQLDFLEKEIEEKEAEVAALEKEVAEAEKRSDLQLETIEQISEENKDKCKLIREQYARIEELENINAKYARQHLRPRYADMDGGKDQIVIRKPERVQSISIYFKDE